MTTELLTMALQMAGCIVVTALAGVGFVRAVCWYADKTRGH